MATDSRPAITSLPPYQTIAVIALKPRNIIKPPNSEL